MQKKIFFLTFVLLFPTIIGVGSDVDFFVKEIYLSNERPMEGETIVIYAKVSNAGEDSTGNITFYDGANIIAEFQIFLRRNETREFSANWDTTGKGGWHTLIVLASVFGDVNEDNNIGTKNITVFTKHDMLIDSANVFQIDSNFTHSANVLLKEKSKLYIKNSFFFLYQDYPNQFSFFIEENSTLDVSSSIIKSNYPFKIIIAHSNLFVRDSTVSSSIFGEGIIEIFDSYLYGDVSISGAYFSNSIAEGIELRLIGSNNIINSEFNYKNFIFSDAEVHAKDIVVNSELFELYCSVVHATNITASNIKLESSMLYIYRYLKIDAFDYIGAKVKNVFFELRCYMNNSIYKIGSTDAYGSVVFEVLTDIVQQSFSSFKGNYKIIGYYKNEKIEKSVVFQNYPSISQESNTLQIKFEFNSTAEYEKSDRDMYVAPGEVKEISNFSQSNSIWIEGKLKIRNGELFIYQKRDYEYAVIVKNEGVLILDNSRIASNYNLSIYIENGVGEFINSIIQNIAVNNSQISINGCEINGKFFGRRAKTIIEGTKLNGSISITSEKIIIDDTSLNATSVLLSGNIEIKNSDFYSPYTSIHGDNISISNTIFKQSTNESIFYNDSYLSISGKDLLINTTEINSSHIFLNVSVIKIQSTRFYQIPFFGVSAEVYISNTSIQKIEVRGKTKVSEFSELKVYTNDFLGMAIDANIKIINAENGTIHEERIAKNGFVSFLLLSRVFDEKGEKFLGNYRIEGRYGEYIKYENISLTSNMNLTLVFPLISTSPLALKIEMKTSKENVTVPYGDLTGENLTKTIEVYGNVSYIYGAGVSVHARNIWVSCRLTTKYYNQTIDNTTDEFGKFKFFVLLPYPFEIYEEYTIDVFATGEGLVAKETTKLRAEQLKPKKIILKLEI
ncbi:MAG: hypothetical protein AB1779_01645, partial [Candidatus Thermoplasmatota archaeon]